MLKQSRQARAPSNEGGSKASALSQCSGLDGKRLLLSWRNVSPPAVGQQFTAVAKLKAPWGAANPGGFNYRRWLIASGYAGTGYVRSLQRIDEDLKPPIRSQWAEFLRSTLSNKGLVRSGVLQALVTGDGGHVSPQVWEVYRLTGTIHLLVVSGLHVSTLSIMLFVFLLYPSRLMGLYRRRDAAALIAGAGVCLGALFLGWFTGAGSPVMRVAVTLVGLFALKLFQRRSAFGSVLLLSMLLTTLAMPLQVFHPGFWLSYGAVAVLLFFFLPRRPSAPSLSGSIQAQLVLIVGLSSLTALVVGESALVALPANYLAVPLLTLITVPCLFFGLCCAALGGIFNPVLSGALMALADVLLHLADFSVVLIEHLMTALLGIVPKRSISVGFAGLPTTLFALISGLIVLLPLSPYLRIGAWGGLLALGLQTQSAIPAGEFCIRVVDVGQGSAAFVDTAQHRLLIDTGPGFETGNLARSQILPTLRTTGKHDLDLVLLSHADLDHAGGLEFFRDYFEPLPMLGPENCPHQESWVWDGVRFTTLQAVNLKTDNDRSCTLLVQAQFQGGTRSVFFSGDISELAEEQLLPYLPGQIHLLLAPHHGSGSSSSIEFVRHLSPSLVVYSAGRDNRYTHPHPRVALRYEWEESRQLNTATSGAIQWCSRTPQRVRLQRSPSQPAG